MTETPVPSYLRPIPPRNDEAKNLLLGLAKKNNFSVCDETIKKMESHQYSIEQEFFNDLINIAREYLAREHSLELPKIFYHPRLYERFGATHELCNGNHVIFIDHAFINFLNNFTMLSFVSMTEPRDKEDSRIISNYLIGIVNLCSYHRENMGMNEYIAQTITKNEKAARNGCLFARAMISFMICHEIAHIALEHKGQGIQEELEADALGLHILSKHYIAMRS